MLWVDTGLQLNVKKYGNTSVYIIKHISMFYLEVSISYMKMAVFLGAAKYVVGLL